jgi:hypothetical protein
MGGIPCLIYAAKSTEDRRGSIPGQFADCAAAIATCAGRSVIAEYEDEGFSAFTGNRGPKLVEAMLHAEALVEEDGTVELWVQHSDRLARGDGQTARHTVEIALWALKHRVKIRTVQDPDTFRDLLYAVVTGQRNHEDSRRKGLSSQSGRQRAAARGDFIGYRPDGYRVAVYLDEDGAVRKQMVFDPDRQPVFETIFQLALAGTRPAAITAALRERGWLTKPSRRGDRAVPWTIGRVIEVLQNPRYASLALFGGEIVARGHWPAYISEPEHQRLRQMVEQRRPTKAPRQLESYLLARLLRCGRCGESMYCSTGLLRADETFARRYLCSGRRAPQHNGCDAPALEADMVEAMFVACLRVLLLDPRDQADAPEEGSRPSIAPGSARRELVDAVLAGQDIRIDRALEQIVAFGQPRLAGHSHRRTRELKLASDFDTWAEIERAGRTDASRKQAAALNRALRGLFAKIEITTSETTVRFNAQRRTPQDGAAPPRASAEVDLREWSRHGPLARRASPRYRTWTKAEIIGALQAWTDQHGRQPGWPDLQERRGNCPSGQTIAKHFGTLKAALRAASPDGREPAGQTPSTAENDGDAIWALAAWTAHHGRQPP